MSATLLQRTTPKARKPHQCHNCGDEIAAGHRYENQRIAYDGTAWTYKSHLACHEICMAYANNYALGDDEMPYADVWDEVLEWWNYRSETAT